MLEVKLNRLIVLNNTFYYHFIFPSQNITIIPVAFYYTVIIVLQWLQTEALQNNPKIEHTFDGKFIFKPVYKIKDKKSLLR